jgi:hypothetical protein
MTRRAHPAPHHPTTTPPPTRHHTPKTSNTRSHGAAAAAHVISRAPRLLHAHPDALAAKAAALVEALGFRDEAAVKPLVRLEPRLMSHAADTLQRRVAALGALLGCSPAALRRVVVAQPALLHKAPQTLAGARGGARRAACMCALCACGGGSVLVWQCVGHAHCADGVVRPQHLLAPLRQRPTPTPTHHTPRTTRHAPHPRTTHHTPRPHTPGGTQTSWRPCSRRWDCQPPPT